jgi:PAS domain S-box-containing protein
MEFIITLLTQSPYLNWPGGTAASLFGLAAWLALLAAGLYLLRKWRRYQGDWTTRAWMIFLGLVVATPLTSLFLGLRLHANNALPPPGIPVEAQGPAMMVFLAVPWVLAGGLLGPIAAGGVAFTSGLFYALWETHNPFTPLIFSLLAVGLSVMVQQRYRTRLYRLMRRPIGASMIAAAIYPFLFLFGAIMATNDILAGRVDYALTNLAPVWLAFTVELVIAGLFGEAIAAGFSTQWGSGSQLIPSPEEKSLHTRLLHGLAAMVVVLMLTLMVGDWLIAGRSARQLLRDRMAETAEKASAGIPYFLEVGQSLITQFSDEINLRGSSPERVQSQLEQNLRKVPYFHQLYVLDVEGDFYSGYPQEDFSNRQTSPEEQVGIQLILNGSIPYQAFTLPPEEGGTAAQISFVSSITGPDDQVEGVLIGDTVLNNNIFTKPILNSLTSLVEEDGEGLLLNEDGRILFHTDSSLVMEQYSGKTSDEAAFFDETAPDGTRNLVYYQPSEGRPWTVILKVPARRTQQTVIQIAAPMLVIILFLAGTIISLSQVGLSRMTNSLRSLALEAGRIAEGQLENALPVEGEDELGQLRRAFERMRLGLKGRMEELNRLLYVSQGVASSLEMEHAVEPVLESAIEAGANTVRVVLMPSAVPELDGDSARPFVYSRGKDGATFSAMDERILGLARQRNLVQIPNLPGTRLGEASKSLSQLGALLAVSLRQDNQFYGAFYVAYEQPHRFTEEEVRFFTTLAGHSAVAAANARNYLSAEIGRRRLEAILDSTPDPVLVTDRRGRLLLANPAAWRALGLGVDWDRGKPVKSVISQDILVELLSATSEEKNSAEVNLPDGRIYYATASTILAEGQRVGRVCVLRDVTRFKEVDALKSDFVATVSHDLRSPLTLMRGYTTMLEMVGELNDTQMSYVRKIMDSVDSMTRLVSDLLDLGRIEAGLALQLEMIPVRDIVETVTGAFQLQAAQKQIQLEVDIPDQTIPLLEGDRALLQQMMQNLVENAIKYTESGGKIAVRVRLRQNQMIFEVSDTGIGIAPVDQALLFEKFYRGARKGKKQPRGTGLGLAIVKSIIELHGGKIWVESQLGKGSRFYVALPLRQAKKRGKGGQSGSK